MKRRLYTTKGAIHNTYWNSPTTCMVPSVIFLGCLPDDYCVAASCSSSSHTRLGSGIFRYAASCLTAPSIVSARFCLCSILSHHTAREQDCTLALPVLSPPGAPPPGKAPPRGSTRTHHSNQKVKCFVLTLQPNGGETAFSHCHFLLIE